MDLRFRNVPSTSPLKSLRAAGQWYGEKLMGKRLADNVRVDVTFIKDFHKNTGNSGTCIWEDDNIRPREFTIELDASDEPDLILQNLAHEMVHVKQWARGELKDSMRGHSLCKWMGKEFDTDKNEYYDLPWEIEAFGREYGLFARWRDHFVKQLEDVNVL